MLPVRGEDLHACKAFSMFLPGLSELRWRIAREFRRESGIRRCSATIERSLRPCSFSCVQTLRLRPHADNHAPFTVPYKDC